MEAMGVSLSDIKFNYIDKIKNVDDRVMKYREIIDDYDQKIKVASDKGINADSLLKAKSNYERRINNLEKTKEYYSEFVDTSDYLMQNTVKISDNIKYEQLSIRYDSLVDEKQRLELSLDDTKRDLEKTKETRNTFKERADKYRKQRDNYKRERDEYLELLGIGRIQEKALREQKRGVKKQYQEKINTVKNTLKELNKEVKGKNREIHRLNEELKMVTDTNDYLERKNQELQDYCNDLLNRPMVGGE